MEHLMTGIAWLVAQILICPVHPLSCGDFPFKSLLLLFGSVDCHSERLNDLLITHFFLCGDMLFCIPIWPQRSQYIPRMNRQAHEQ